MFSTIPLQRQVQQRCYSSSLSQLFPNVPRRLTHRNFTNFTIKFEYNFLVEFLLAKRWTLQNIFEVLILRIFGRKEAVFFVFLQNIVLSNNLCTKICRNENNKTLPRFSHHSHHSFHKSPLKCCTL